MTIAETTFVAALATAGRLFDECGFGFALIGGGAIVARVRPRFTQDLDFLVEMRRDQLDRLLEVATAHSYGFDEAQRPLFEEGLIHLTSEAGGISLDLIRADSPFLREVVERASPVASLPETIPVATLEDLILLKLEAARPIDVEDVLDIKEARGSVLDRGYLDARARDLQLSDALKLYFD